LIAAEDDTDLKTLVKLKGDKAGVLVNIMSKVELVFTRILLADKFLVDSTDSVEDIETIEVGVTCKVLNNDIDAISVEF
jgi:hypothetical protein